MNFVPVLVSVYDRIGHLQRCIDSLRANEVSRLTELYVVSDAAHRPEFEPAITRVRSYIRSIDGFKRVTPIERESNLGSFVSINSAIDCVLEKHGRLVFLEDDNIVSGNFLEFMNDCLNFYRDDSSVFSVSGYNYPIRIPTSYKQDVYKWQGFTAWGVGLWKDRWSGVDLSREGAGDFLANRSMSKALRNVSERAFLRACRSMETDRLTTDTLVTLNLVSTGRYSIFPVVSRVRNVGLDGTGEHCETAGGEVYSNQAMDSGANYELVRDLAPDSRINQVLKRHFRVPLRYKIARKTPASAKALFRWAIR